MGENDAIDQIGAESVRNFIRAMGIGKTHFYSEVRAGRIFTVKSGRRTLVPLSERRGYLERLAAAGGGSAPDHAIPPALRQPGDAT